MIVVDASVWVSTLFATELDHSLSSNWLNHVIANSAHIIVPSLFLAEIAGAAARRAGSTTAGEKVLHDVQSNPAVAVIDVDYRLGTHAARVAAALSLRGADAVYVALAERTRSTLVTLDLEVIARARALIDVRLPS